MSETFRPNFGSDEAQKNQVAFLELLSLAGVTHEELAALVNAPKQLKAVIDQIKLRAASALYTQSELRNRSRTALRDLDPEKVYQVARQLKEKGKLSVRALQSELGAPPIFIAAIHYGPMNIFRLAYIKAQKDKPWPPSEAEVVKLLSVLSAPKQPKGEEDSLKNQEPLSTKEAYLDKLNKLEGVIESMRDQIRRAANKLEQKKLKKHIDNLSAVIADYTDLVEELREKVSETENVSIEEVESMAKLLSRVGSTKSGLTRFLRYRLPDSEIKTEISS